MNSVYTIALTYIAVISTVTVIVTVYDKIAAKKRPKHRVRENTLLLLAIFGGSLAELLTMLVIRHKTKHKKFMVGLPVILLAQAAITFIVLYYLFLRALLWD